MRYFFPVSLILCALVFFIHVPTTHADPSGTIDGQSCNGGAGVMKDGQCVTTGAGNNQTVTNGAGNTSGSGAGLVNPLRAGTSLETFLNNILDFVIRIGAIIIVLMLVYVGYLFVVAQGAPGEIEHARTALLWTLVGALVLLGAKAISLAIQATVTAIGG